METEWTGGSKDPDGQISHPNRVLDVLSWMVKNGFVSEPTDLTVIKLTEAAVKEKLEWLEANRIKERQQVEASRGSYKHQNVSSELAFCE